MSNMEFKRKVDIPKDIRERYPLTDDLKAIKQKNDEEIRKIFTGEDDRLLLIIGPCSADREDAVIDYCKRLRKVQEAVKDELLLVPRVYTNKPRTTGEGYKGMLHQPDPTADVDMIKGVIAVRQLHIDVLKETGFSTADEMLYPDNYRYLYDVLSYVAVGARSVENQEHRLVASGVDAPVGMKNPTSGDYKVMLNSVKAAQLSHTFIYRGWEVSTKGNELTHTILRGYNNKHGESTPNYHYEDILRLINMYDENTYKNPGIIVDCNHSNSGKQFEEQIRIAKEVLHSTRHNEKVYKYIKGLMIESYIEDGNQKPDGGVYGKSITDACIGWEKTEKLLNDLADLRRAHRALRAKEAK
ncbi:MAG: 3-deoxy-7-phosphoheptulonate synthase [Acholeplasmatales bacterium]|nr:3-deoxy-7-phosphoheptulonate synthase [Acholeplasmatales bacterium]